VRKIKVKRFGKSFEIYPWLKGRLFHKMITGHETFQKKNFKLYLKQLLSLFYGCWNIFGRYDIWVFTTSMERRLVDGKYVDKLFDYIGNELGYKTLIFELRVFQYIPYRKIASRKAISRSVLMLMETVYAKLFLRKVELEGREELKELLKTVEGGVDHPWLIRKYLAQYRIMKMLLKRFPNPKLVMMSVAYTNFGYIQAFKEKGIKVVEMQHGVITDNHHAYFYAVQMDAMQFPDVILTNGECQKEVFSGENKFPLDAVIPVGSYIIDHYKHRTTSKQKKKMQVLFAMQEGEIGDKLVDFILNLSKEYNHLLDIIIQPRRMAPADYTQKWPELVNVGFSTSSFYNAIGKVDAHSTIYSTTAIESLSMGVPNILVNIEGQSLEQLGNVIGNNPYTHLVETPETFVSALEKVRGVNGEEVLKSNEYNIKPAFKKNIKEVIKTLTK
jgi:hypothetical protein